MAKTRLELQSVLEQTLGSRNVYFQPPASVKMKYPAIVYSRSDIDNRFANNEVYHQSHVYRVTIIDEDPDSEIVQKMSKFKTAKFERHFTTNGLNHDIFSIFY